MRHPAPYTAAALCLAFAGAFALALGVLALTQPDPAPVTDPAPVAYRLDRLDITGDGYATTVRTDIATADECDALTMQQPDDGGLYVCRPSDFSRNPFG